MAKTPVTLRLDPGAYVSFHIDLLGSGGVPTQALELGEYEVLAKRVVTGKMSTGGVALVSLDPTSLITPAETAYRVTWSTPGGGTTMVFTVPVSATAVEAAAYQVPIPTNTVLIKSGGNAGTILPLVSGGGAVAA